MLGSLRSRLWMTYALIIGVVLTILGLAFLAYLARNPLSAQRLTLATRTVLQRLPNLELRTSPARFQEALARVDESFDVRLVVLGPDDSVLFDTRSDRAPALVYERALAAGRTNGTLRDSSNQTWQYLARPLEGGLTLLAATPRLRPLATLLASLGDNLVRPFLYAALGALVLALLLSILMARWVSAPLQHLADGARAISAGEYKPIELEGPQEVKALGKAFNEMAARVQTSRQSQRDFVANVSHELKTPLTSIQGFAQAILDGTANTPESLRQAGGVIFSEASRMHRLVLDLLDLARLDAGTMALARTPISLSLLLDQVVQKFLPMAEKTNVDLVTDIEGLPAMVGDADRLSQVFTNLVDNALKHTPAGGRISIIGRTEAGLVEVAVSDTGPGIPEDELSRIFERFYQLDKSRPGGTGRGAGLGLAIANQIVQAHSGELRVYSKPGQGSVFSVRLPVIQADDETISIRRKRALGGEDIHPA